MRFIDPKAVHDAVEEMDEASDDTPPPLDHNYIIPAASLPSSKERNFLYRWSGIETGEGEWQDDSNQHTCFPTLLLEPSLAA